jgi:ligand-binding SRPBCC domain-containing protein
LEEAWKFFSSPANLKVITPPYMGFDIISGGDRPMFAGQIIQYIVTPVAGIKTKWVTEITHVKEPYYFVDEQRFGPYALWHHKHFLREIDGGVEMEDIIDYKLPFGIIGQAVHPFMVKPKLEEIFNFRRNKLIELFGSYKKQAV